MSNPPDRRAAQKARTRATIKDVAHEMFAAQGFEATTIVEIAAAAGVSVQTVFNHFASKEELFFADRAEWVEAPANAVRTRAPGVAADDGAALPTWSAPSRTTSARPRIRRSAG